MSSSAGLPPSRQAVLDLIRRGERTVNTLSAGLRISDNAVRLQLHALAYNLANFLRSLALPQEVEQWSLTTLREKLVKIGAKVVRHGRYASRGLSPPLSYLQDGRIGRPIWEMSARRVARVC